MAQAHDNMIRCTGCWSWLPTRFFNVGGGVRCPACRNRLEVCVFRSLFRSESKGRAAQKLDQDGLASCFFHPKKKAVVPCDRCGRFLCTLCDVDWADQHVCPACIEAQLDNPAGADDHAVRKTLYDRIALGLAVLPAILFITLPLTAITAPAAIYFAVRYWNRVRHPVLTPLWNVAAILIALATLAGWVYLFSHKFGGIGGFF
ncbi:MAG: hypothetical protein HZA50_11070 [Planctomycetes bacterium]|nr:hypothetical protein [Planctomycetota bacterium]